MASKDARRLNPGIQVGDLFVGIGSKVDPHLIPKTSDPQLKSYSVPSMGEQGAAPSVNFALNSSGSMTDLTPSDWLSASAIDFDGGNEYLNMSTNSNFDFEYNSPFTLAGWTHTTNTSEDTIISKMASSDSYRGWSLRTAAGRIRFYLINTWSSKTIDVISTSTTNVITDGYSHHVAVTYDGSTNAAGVTLYIDGDAVSKTTSIDNLGNDTTVNTIDINIARDDYGNYFDGYLAHVAVWNKELSSGEIDAVYNSGKPGNLLTHAASASLVAWWKTGDGSSGSLDDDTNSSDSDARIYDMSTGSHDVTPENTEKYDIQMI